MQQTRILEMEQLNVIQLGFMLSIISTTEVTFHHCMSVVLFVSRKHCWINFN